MLRKDFEDCERAGDSNCEGRSLRASSRHGYVFRFDGTIAPRRSDESNPDGWAGRRVGLHRALSVTPEVRLLVFTGFLGGFTTFSAFGVETVSLLQKGQWAVAAAYVLLSVACGLAALWFALKAGGMAGA